MDDREIKRLAYSLKQVDPRTTKLNRRWFKGEGLYFDVIFDLGDNDEIEWFEFTLGGKELRWERNSPGIHIGRTNELETSDRPHAASKVVYDVDRSANGDFINLVKAILQARAEEPLFAKALTLFDG